MNEHATNRSSSVPVGEVPARADAQTSAPSAQAGQLTLAAETAADLMTRNVVSIAAASIQEAVTLFTERALGALPVIDGNGKAIGVLSRSDVVAFDCIAGRHDQSRPNPDTSSPFHQRLQEHWPHAFREPQVTRVQDIMSPVVFAVAPGLPAAVVVDTLLALGVHHLFVTSRDGEILGVISSIDVLRHLHRASFAGGPSPRTVSP